MQRLWRLLRGYVIIKVKGAGLEVFLNKAASEGIALWDTERLGAGMLVASVRAADFRRVRAVCRSQGWKVGLAAKVGLPFLLSAVLRRKALLAGAALSAAAVWVASSYVWFVHVDAYPGAPREQILAVAASHGLRPGSLKNQVDPERVQTALLLEIDELSWAAVSVEGTRAVIRAAERVGAPLFLPGDLIARKDGIIEEIVAFEGIQVVHPGDTVKAGEVLISGFIPPDAPEHRRLLEQGKPPYVRADGIVKARVWYEGRAAARTAVVDETPTGRQAVIWELSLGGRSFRVGRLPRYDAARELERSWVWTVGSFQIGLRRLSVEEVHREVKLLSEEEARREAIEAARARLEAVLPEGATFAAEPELEILAWERDGHRIVEAVIRAEVIEEIHGFRSIQF